MIQKSHFQEPFPFELYLPSGPGPFPLICLTPILGRLLFLEDLFLERYFARFFTAHGFASALIDRPIFEFNPARGLEQIQDYLDESVSRNKKVLDFLVTQKEIDPARVGSFGISFGAVVNSLWAATDPRLKAHVFSLAGGNLPEILITSRDPLMRSYLKAIVKATGLEKENLKADFERTLKLDPLGAAPLIPKERVLMILGLFDRVIQFRCGLAFWRALGKPKTLFLPLGHYPSLLAVPLLNWIVLAFFKRRLGPATQSRESLSGVPPIHTKRRAGF